MMIQQTTLEKSIFTLGLISTLFVIGSGNAMGQSVDAPFETTIPKLEISIGEIPMDSLTLNGPALKQPIMVATKTIRSIQSERQSREPTKSIVESSAPRTGFNPFSSTSQSNAVPSPRQLQSGQPTRKSQWMAAVPANVTPQLNAPQLNAPQLNAPQLNAPQLYSPHLNAPTPNLKDSNIMAPVPSRRPPTMSSPRSLNYVPFPRNPQTSIQRYAPQTCVDEFDCPYNRARQSRLQQQSGYRPYGGFGRDEYDYQSRVPRDRHPEFRALDPRTDRMLDEIYQTRRPVVLVPMSVAPIYPYGSRY